MNYINGHYYKRIYNNTNGYSRLFKVLDVFDHNTFMFVLVVRDGKIRNKYECAITKDMPESKTVELNYPERIAVML